MSPLRWIQSTGPHWTVILEEVTLDTLTEDGGAVGAVDFVILANFTIFKTYQLLKSLLTQGH